MSLEEKKIRVINKEEKEYPRRLKEIPKPPEKLYILGSLPVERIPSVAVIGARDCSEYGRYVAARLGSVLGRKGIQVISGMARGIDGIAQEAAVDAGGYSYAVLGSGVDVCYPASNKSLYEKLKVTGGILSEYPPGTSAIARNFPARNRIVSGLADAIIVVEAREKSGTLITVDMALEQGREVYAVPGRITDSLSVGCNRLLKLGAGILLDTDEFLEELKGITAKRCMAWEDRELRENTSEVFRENDRKEAKLPEGEPELLAIYHALDFSPAGPEQIRERLPEKYQGTPIPLLLIRLCMENLAVQVSPGQFCRKE